MESLTMASPRSPIGKNVKFVEEKQLKLLLIGKNNRPGHGSDHLLL